MPTHAEQRRVPYRPDQMFDLVADVERYPEFLPWCVGARVLSRSGQPPHEVILADLMVGFKAFRGTFRSRVTLNRPACRIDVQYTQGPFKYLNNHWIFHAVPDGCIVDFYIDFEFKSRLLQRIIDTMFNEAVQVMVRAFEARAHAIYGRQGQVAGIRSSSPAS